MKRIKIDPKTDIRIETAFGQNRGKFCVTLYWQQSYYFSSKKKALRFIAIANQFYTQCMYEARVMFVDVLVKYHQSWGYFETETSGFELARMNRQCESSLDTCQKSFNLMAERSDFNCGSFLVRGKLDLIIGSMQEAIAVLKKLHDTKSGTMELYTLDVFSKRLYSLEYSLKSFGDYEAENLQKSPMHDSVIKTSALITRAKLRIAV